MGKYFETDGFRGEANVRLTSDHAYKIGRFLGWYFGLKKEAEKEINTKPRIVIGKDTRRSSYMFEYSLIAGLVSSGADAYMLHVTTTPSVAYITRVDEFDCGIMVSASHNPYYDNGIKLINSKGEKMEETVCDLCEAYLDDRLNEVEIFGKNYDSIPFAVEEKIGATVDYISGRNRYIAYLISNGIYSFKGYKIALDCANGASWNIAKAVFDALGATTFVINAEPNGTNINNNAGSTHIEGLQKYVIENNLDVGFAYDGDADRCFAVDEKGNVINGNNILYMAGKYLKKHDALLYDTVVVTIMANLGLSKSLEREGIKTVATNVGDKYVWEELKKSNLSLGGEDSGHIIFSKLATTGDGILTSIKLMEIMIAEKKKFSELSDGLEIYPQTLINVRVNDKNEAINDEKIKVAYKNAEAELEKIGGRIILRKSGTEPIIRVLTEAKEKEICDKYANQVADVIKENHGA
ncbi:MAG: phosphoglucosamine mutase [Clostridia bacterium]|nr:phosphoglucosamine mutase [Clostridia bacterium]